MGNEFAINELTRKQREIVGAIRAYALQQETPDIGPWIQEFRLNPKFIKME